MNNEKQLNSLFESHAKVLADVRYYDSRMDELTPYEISKMQYLYTIAERQAWRIAGHYKRLYKYHEGMAEIDQGREYKAVRMSESKLKSGIDGQYLSRMAKGDQLIKAADYEGDFITWRGVAGTYERAINSLKDMLKAITAEGGSQR